MIAKISWKNVWRNKTRSLVVITSVTLGILAGILLIGIMQGWVEQRMYDAIHNEVSHIQIHNTHFLENEDLASTLNNISETISAVESLPEMRAWVKRTKLTAIATTPWGSTGLFVYGIEPEKEKKVSEIHTRIVNEGGEYPGSSPEGTILISDKTAEVLKIKQYVVTEKSIDLLMDNKVPGDIVSKLNQIKDTRFRIQEEFEKRLREILSAHEIDRYGALIMKNAVDYRIRSRVQITFSDINGNPVQGVFRVCGIYKTTNTGYDQATAFVNIEDLASLYGATDPLIHEIAVILDDIKKADLAKKKLSEVSAGNTVSSWKDLAPDAAMMNDYMIFYYFIFIGIIMLALAFGIINTMLMAILERTKELGMLMAIGMNRKKIFSMIMLETTFLTSVGAIAGMLAGWGMISILSKTGIHFSGWGEGFESIGYAASVYPRVTLEFFIFIVLMVFFTAILSSIWPAHKALRLNPLETLRTE